MSFEVLAATEQPLAQTPRAPSQSMGGAAQKGHINQAGMDKQVPMTPPIRPMQKQMKDELLVAPKY